VLKFFAQFHLLQGSSEKWTLPHYLGRLYPKGVPEMRRNIHQKFPVLFGCAVKIHKNLFTPSIGE